MKPVVESRLVSAGLALAVLAALLLGAASALVGTCGPFTDTANDPFCPFVLEIFYLGITTGTSPTTYNPSGDVTRLQMAAFLSRSVDGVLRRGSRRALVKKFWTPQDASLLGLTTVGAFPGLPTFDGADLWVPSTTGTVSRVHAGNGRLLETWTGAGAAFSALIAMNRVVVAGTIDPGSLYTIDPGQPAGAVTTVASTLGGKPQGIAFDGERVWTANFLGSVSIVTPGAIPWTVTTVTVGATGTSPSDVLYDGANVWSTDGGLGRLVKLDGSGAVLQTVTVGANPLYPVFDGTNIWVPNGSGDDSVTVVRASNGTVLQTLTGNGLGNPVQAAFDGERILVTNLAANVVSLWKAADLTPLGFFPTGNGTNPIGACSDGVAFWITLHNTQQLARF